MGLPSRVAALAALLIGLSPRLFGAEGSDPLAWLDDGSSPKTTAWVEAQDRKARQALESRPGRQELRARLQALLGAQVLGPVMHRGPKFFYLKRRGGQAQPALHVRDAPGDPPRALVDPNPMSSSGTVALGRWQPSHDGLMLAYGLVDRGVPAGIIRVREVDSGLDLPDRVPSAGDSSVAWLADRTGFYYTRREGVYFHLMGDDSRKDQPAFRREGAQWLEVETSPDGRFLLVTAYLGWDRSELHLRDRQEPKEGFMAVASGDALYEARIGGETIFIRTNEGAPRFKVMAVDLRKGYRLFGTARGAKLARHRDFWRVVSPEGPWPTTAMAPVGAALAVEVLERGVSRVKLYGADGKPLREVPLPLSGSVASLDGHRGSPLLALIREDFLAAPVLQAYDLERSSMTIIETAPSIADADEYESHRVSVPVPDWSPVALTLLHKKRLRRDRTAPILIDARDGFQAAPAPEFMPGLLPWLDRGGVYALPDLRPAERAGPLKAGGMEKRLSDFEGLLAAVRWLIEQEYTSPERIALLGDSTGALIADAALARAPELFAAAVLSAPPRMDWGRYQGLKSRLWWLARDGPPDREAARRWLTPYSAYHRERGGPRYPALLFISREDDSEGARAHARKLAAFLVEKQKTSPALLRSRPAGESGPGAATAFAVEEWLDRYVFFFWRLGI